MLAEAEGCVKNEVHTGCDSSNSGLKCVFELDVFNGVGNDKLLSFHKAEHLGKRIKRGLLHDVVLEVVVEKLDQRVGQVHEV